MINFSKILKEDFFGEIIKKKYNKNLVLDESNLNFKISSLINSEILLFQKIDQKETDLKIDMGDINFEKKKINKSQKKKEGFFKRR